MREQLDKQLIDLIFKVNDEVVKKKQLEIIKHEHIKQEMHFNHILQQQLYLIKRFGAYLQFETHNNITIRRIEHNNLKFQRCQKALNENANNAFFSMDNQLNAYDWIELVEAFKIENSLLLK